MVYGPYGKYYYLPKSMTFSSDHSEKLLSTSKMHKISNMQYKKIFCKVLLVVGCLLWGFFCFGLVLVRFFVGAH